MGSGKAGRMALFGRSKDPQQQLQAALRSGDHEAAIPIYEQLLKKEPKNQQLRLRYADSLAEAGRRQGAVGEYMDVAQTMATTGFLIKAIAVYKKLVKLDPSREDFHRELAEMNRAREQGVEYKPPEEREEAPPSTETPDGAPDTQTEEAPGEPAPTPAEEPAAAPAPTVEEREPAADAVPAETESAAEATAAEAVPNEAPPAEAAPAATGDDFDLDEFDAAIDATVQEDPEAVKRARRTHLDPSEAPRIPLFSDFSVDEFAEVVTALRTINFRPGQVIVEEGSPGESMFVIVHGKVKVTTQSPSGKEVELATLEEGEFFGEISLLSGKPRTATIRSLQDTEVLELTRPAYESIVEKHPGVKETLHRFWKERTDRTVEAMVASMQADDA